MNLTIRNRPATAVKNAQRGFALLMVMFMATLVFLSAMVAIPYLKTERQREKEQEMIWRGKQYVRGIKLYYRKTGRFPTSLDDLTKPKLGSIRFMRQAYKDPMNKEDGTWRMIYVGPGGQLIGSLKPPQNFQLPGQLGVQPGANPQQQNSAFSSSGFGQSAPAGAAQPGQPGTTQSAATPAQGTAPAPGTAAADDAAALANPSGLISDSPVLGGNIIGVGSKVNKRSVIIYDKAKNYRLFEFIWNPSKDVANALNQQIGAPNQNPQGTAPAPGQSGFGGGFGTAAPGTTPPPAVQPMPAPGPAPTQNPPQQ
jgi:hypothetical protein